ncbi:MAG: response regulator transcription factor [Candidatus Hydrogenedentes bacterium]|nr:response regulator transcription factor [Candidatus Hydrogenedentota bacterium]
MKVLVVEDEQRILQFVRKGLDEAGFTVEICDNGDDALDRASTHTYDVVVLDIMLPGRDGLSVLRQLREKKNAVPVILLTARSALDERVEGLNLGADDYLTKPFYVEELIARLHALGRRSSGQTLTILQSEGLAVNLVTREVTRNEKDVRLTAREFELLEYLMRAPGRVYTRTQILEHVWGYDFDPNTNLVDVHIQRLRKKLDAPGDSLIETIRGVGYRFRKE